MTIPDHVLSFTATWVDYWRHGYYMFDAQDRTAPSGEIRDSHRWAQLGIPIELFSGRWTVPRWAYMFVIEVNKYRWPDESVVPYLAHIKAHHAAAAHAISVATDHHEAVAKFVIETCNADEKFHAPCTPLTIFEDQEHGLEAGSSGRGGR